MLFFTGQYKDKSYKAGDTIDASMISQDFALPEAQGDNSFMLTYVKRKIKIRDGKKTLPRSYRPVSEYPLRDPSKNINGRLRWATNATPEGNGMFRFDPAFVEVQGEMMTIPARDYDKFVFMALHPTCADSPFVGRDPHLQIYDPAREAKGLAERNRAIMEVRKAIWEMPDEKLYYKARGIIVQGRTVTMDSTTPMDFVRNELSNFLDEYKETFIKAWQSESSVLIGLLADARDVNKIEYVANTGGGRPGWLWRAGDKTGEVACHLSATDDPWRALVTWASQAHNYDDVLSYLTRLMPAEEAKVVFSKEEAPKENKQQQESPWVAKVQEAIAAGVIAYDRDTSSVVWLDEQGNIEGGKPLIEGVTIKDWVKKLTDLIGTQQGLYVRSTLNKKLSALVAEAA